MKKSILLATLILTLAGSTGTQVYANSIEDNNNIDGINQYIPNASHYIALYSGDLTKSDNRLYIEYTMG